MKYNTMRSFASDNNAGTHPDIMKAIIEANEGHVIGYGDDPYTEKAIGLFKTYFGDAVDLYFVYGGTAANVLGLAAITESFNSVICADTAHIYVDECSAPEKFSGCKLLPVKTVDGKLTPDDVRPHLHGFGFPHHAQPKVISITQPTEMGTVYTPEEILQLRALADEFGLYLHMDGARISNAAAFLDLPFRSFTVDAGVDVLSFGGTKNGMMFGEAVLFFNPEISVNFKYIRKQGMQLHSKMRYIAAQFNAFLSNDLWLRNARHANRMAGILADRIKDIHQVRLTQKVQTNGVFAIIPETMIPKLQDIYFFYIWDEGKHEVRWMTSWDTETDDIERFTRAIKEVSDK